MFLALALHHRAAKSAAEADGKVHHVDELLHLAASLCVHRTCQWIVQHGERGHERRRKTRGGAKLTARDLAHLEGHERAQVIDPLVERSPHLPQDLATLGRSDVPPHLVGEPGRLEGLVDVVARRRAHFRERLARRRVARCLQGARAAPAGLGAVVDTRDGLARSGELERREDRLGAGREGAGVDAAGASRGAREAQHVL